MFSVAHWHQRLAWRSIRCAELFLLRKLRDETVVQMPLFVRSDCIFDSLPESLLQQHHARYARSENEMFRIRMICSRRLDGRGELRAGGISRTSGLSFSDPRPSIIWRVRVLSPGLYETSIAVTDQSSSAILGRFCLNTILAPPLPPCAPRAYPRERPAHIRVLRVVIG